MRTSEALDLALRNGWTDDSTWTRASVRAQVSRRYDEAIAYVTVPHDGPVTWQVQHSNCHTSRHRGTANTVTEARTAAEQALTASLGVLF